MIRATLCALALIALAATPLACDKDDGEGQDTAVGADTVQDVAPAQDTLTDTPPVPDDTAGDTPPPEDVLADSPPPPMDSLEDAPPPMDLLEDGWPDISWDWTEDGWEDVPCDGVEDVPWEDVPCEGPQYSEDCAEVPFFQCGFMGFCEEGVLYAEWHEHVFCEGQENIIDYWCEHPCACKDGEIMDWPADGAAYVDGYCKAEPGCDIPPLYAGVSLADILADPGAFDGDAVSFTGPVSVGNAICTLAECTEEDPCCNGCGASYVATGDGGTIEIVGGGIPQVGCSGSNCDFMDNCSPFPTAPASYILWGTLDAQYGTSLYLDGWCTAE
jgi:hypothetical protein